MSDTSIRPLSSLTSSCWPTPQQLLLLRAALLTGDDALRAWNEWQATHDVDSVDHQSFRVLPLLYHNLQMLGVKHACIGKLKGLHRRTWYTNQLLLQPMAELLASLHTAGIPTMLLKGAALVLQYYGDFGVRPMGDVDILVPTHQAADAYQVLRDRGWSTHLGRESLTPGYLAFKHGDSFENHVGRSVDLHWHVLHREYSAAADDEFWQARIPIQLGDVATSALSPADQLLHVCTHGTVCKGTPQLRPVADTVVVLRNCPDLDWKHLLVQAKRHRVVLAMRETLTYLQQMLAPQIPMGVLRELQRLPVSRAEARTFRSLTVHPSRQGPLLAAWTVFHPYAPLLMNIEGWRTLRRLAVSYQNRHRLAHLGAVALHIGGRWTAKIRRGSMRHRPVGPQPVKYQRDA